MIRVGVSGAAGRMGQAVCEAVEGADDMELVGRADPSLEMPLAECSADSRRGRGLHDAGCGAGKRRARAWSAAYTRWSGPAVSTWTAAG